MKSLSRLVSDLKSVDPEIFDPAIDDLVKRGGDDVFDVLIPLLKSGDSRFRHRAAIALRELGDSRAIGPLIEAIEDPAHAGYNGTFIYALQTMNCSKLFSFLFDLAFHQSYEVRSMALMVLQEQGFCVSRNEVDDSTRTLEKYANDKPDDDEAQWRVRELRTVLSRLTLADNDESDVDPAESA